MNSYEITYPKYNIDILPHQYGYYLHVIFKCCEKQYLVTKITKQINLIKNYRLLCDLQNKNSELYLEVVKAINNFDEAHSKYTISNKISKKILGKVDIFIKNVQIVTELYQNEVVRYLNSKNELIPLINIYYVQT